MKTKLVLIGLFIGAVACGQATIYNITNDSSYYITKSSAYINNIGRSFLQATVSAGADDTITAGDTYQLAGTQAYMDSVVWTTSGTGDFDNDNLLTATYTPSAADITAGSVTLTLTGYVGGASTGDGMVLTIEQGYSEEAIALFARMEAIGEEPTDERKELINQVITELKDSLVWNKLDALWIMAAHGEGSSKLNWIKDDYNLTDTTNTSFTVDYGYTFNGTTNFLNTNFNCAGTHTNYSQNNASIGIYSYLDKSETKCDIGARTGTSDYTGILSKIVEGTSSIRLHNGTNPVANGTPATSIGQFVVTRSSANHADFHAYYNKIESTYSDGGIGEDVTTVPNANLYIGARNYNGTAEFFSTRAYGFAFTGGYLTVDEISDIYDILVGTWLE